MSESQPPDDLLEDARRYLTRYGAETLPEIIAEARGSYVWTNKGRKILDFTSGQMCATVGHNHPAIVTAIKEASDRAIHLFSGMIPDTVARLGRRLAQYMPAGLDKSLIINTGSESNEAAIKMAKLVTGGFEVVSLGGSWHGVTGQAMSASFASDRKGYGPPTPGAFALPEPYAYRCPVQHCRDVCDQTCLKVGLRMFDMQSSGAPAALIAEPILSAGGVIVPPPGYFETLRDACDERGMLLIFDEAQTAFGRIGCKTASARLGVTPDILNVSKTLGGGIPLAASVTTNSIEEKAFSRGYNFYTSHVSDPLPAAVGLAVIETLERENLEARAVEMGAYLRAQLEAMQQRYEQLGEIRGEGLLLGIELVEDRESRTPALELGAKTTARCMELGLSMNIKRRPERGSVWRVAPPLTVSYAEIDEGVSILDQALRETLDAHSAYVT
ncbi:MAG: aspartate aminotransferase family protein [Chromatiales bacterium]|jgi:2,2-dialkylglycine decarboxylase (pyruvate)|nr:aspartate aminotransferase family protein [Chromatiales bacterium]